MALKLRTHLLLVLLFFALGVLLYLFAVLSSFGSAAFGYDSLVVVALTVVGGLGALILGYASVVVLGGRVSIWVVEFFARFTRSRHVIEAADDKPSTLRDRIGKEYFTFVLPMLVFVIAATLAWDVHNLHDPRTLIFHDLLHVLDVFSKPVTVEPMSYSLEMLLAMLVLVAIAGIVPSIVLPYFRRFKVTGVNSGPFHTDLLFTVVGFVVGLGALLAVLGLVYEVLWVGKGPSYYHYVVPVMLGLSVHYSIGSSWGMDRAETMVQRMLEAREGRRIVRGKVNIQGIRTKNNSTDGDKVRS